MVAKTARTEPKPRARFTPNADAPLVVFVADGEDPLDEGDELFVEFAVPLVALARFWNAVKLRSESCTGLTAKTMPVPQWEAGLVCSHCRNIEVRKEGMATVGWSTHEEPEWVGVVDGDVPGRETRGHVGADGLARNYGQTTGRSGREWGLTSRSSDQHCRQRSRWEHKDWRRQTGLLCGSSGG
jgi:hypothetical protein